MTARTMDAYAPEPQNGAEVRLHTHQHIGGDANKSAEQSQRALWSVASAVLAASLAIVIYWWRDPSQFTAPQLWAEDGAVFWVNQYIHGIKALFIPYAGYLHLAPRVTAALAALFDPARAPRIYAYAAILLTAWSAGTAAACARQPVMGFLYGIALMLPPHPSTEIWGTITNVQWFLAPTLALVAATPEPLSPILRRNRSAFIVVAGLSGPFSIFASVPAAWNIWKRREWSNAIVIGCAVIQGITILIAGQQAHKPVLQELDHVADMAFVRLFPALHANIAAGGALVAAALLIPRRRAMRVQILWFALCLLVTAAVKTTHSAVGFDDWTNGSRYFYAPDVILVWCALSLLLSGPGAATVGGAWLALNAITYPTQFFERPPLKNMHWWEHTRELGRRDLVIPINPDGWIIPVPANADHAR